MAKLMYCLWRKSGTAEDELRDWLTTELATGLLAQKAVSILRIQVVDSAVAQAFGRRIASGAALPDAVVSVYCDSSDQASLAPELVAGDVLQAHVCQSLCYLVEQSEPLENLSHPAISGERVYGYCQVVFLQRPARLSEQQWLDLWQGQHTRVAIETQATFGYRQNRILKCLGQPKGDIHAIVEENFPPEAMTSDQAFYGANTDSELQARMSTMMESCARFIDFDKIDVVPMSEYVFWPQSGLG